VDFGESPGVRGAKHTVELLPIRLLLGIPGLAIEMDVAGVSEPAQVVTVQPVDSELPLKASSQI
jgi:hypothetical protein